MTALGATPHKPRRLQDDRLYDWTDGRLERTERLLRVRRDGAAARLTFKGPPQPGEMKVREEIELSVEDGDALMQLLDRLDLSLRFHYQKYRQELRLGDVVVTIDETPVGTYVELEGDEQGITTIADALGRAPTDYIVDSYHALFLQERERHGIAGPHMVFGP